MKLKLLISSLFFVCLFASCEKEQILLTELPQEEMQTKSKLATNPPPPPADCKTDFYAYRIPYAPNAETQITIANSSTGEIVAQFMGAGTLYNTYLDTDTQYYWVESISSDWFVDYCSCGNNMGTLSHGPSNYSFITSSDNSNYTVCNF